MNPTFCLMLDSFRFADIGASNTPFLTELMGRSLSAEIIPPFCFEPDAAYIAGLYPEESDQGTHFWLKSPPKLITWIGKSSNVLEKLPLGLSRLVRHAVSRSYRLGDYSSGRKYFTTPAKIPFSFLKYFDIVRQKVMFEEGFCNSKTVFDIVRDHGGKWLYFGYPVTSSSIKAIYTKCLQADLRETKFVFTMVNELDKAGHKFGPDSEERKDALKTVDAYLEKIFAVLKERWGDFNFIVFSDHGMVNVRKIVNVRAGLRKLPLVAGQDYVYFLDSTLARFWFFTQKAEDMISHFLQDLGGGKIVTDVEKEEYCIRYNHHRFGDLLYWVDNANLIVPNFFQEGGAIKGMHGYRKDCVENHAAFISTTSFQRASQRIAEPLPMVRIFPSILVSLGLEYERYTSLQPIG